MPSLGSSPFPSPQRETDRNAAQRLLEFYADLAGKAAVPEPKFERASIWFHISTPLSKSELLYAIETTFALDGFAVIHVDDHSIRLGRPAHAPRNNEERLERVPPKQCPAKAVVKERSYGYDHQRRPGRAQVNTAPEMPATELPLLHEMEERAGERRHVGLKPAR